MKGLCGLHLAFGWKQQALRKGVGALAFAFGLGGGLQGLRYEVSTYPLRKASFPPQLTRSTRP